VTISSWLNFGHPAPPGRGSVAGRKFLAPPYYSQRGVCVSLSAFSFEDKLEMQSLCLHTVITSAEDSTPKKTRRSTFQEDLQKMNVTWKNAPKPPHWKDIPGGC